MNTPYHCLLIVLVSYPSILSAICNNYYQSSGPSSTKRPFDMCYHSEIDATTLQGSSYRYYCIESTEREFGNNSVNGFTAFREDFASVDCEGSALQTRIVSSPYRILCEKQEPICEVLRVRTHSIVNTTKCSYNESVYKEDVRVLGICDDNGGDSEALFCNKPESSGDGAYFWSNRYYGGQCEEHRLFEATYQFHGCQGDGKTFMHIVQCDVNEQGMSVEVKPFNDSVFVAGFVLLLLAILTILFILVWYCCWFRTGFNGSRHKGAHLRAPSQHEEHAHGDYDDDEDDGAHMNTTTR